MHKCQMRPRNRPITEQKRPRDLLTQAYLLKARVDTYQKRPIKEQKKPTDTGVPEGSCRGCGRRQEGRGGRCSGLCPCSV